MHKGSQTIVLSPTPRNWNGLGFGIVPPNYESGVSVSFLILMINSLAIFDDNIAQALPSVAEQTRSSLNLMQF